MDHNPAGWSAPKALEAAEGAGAELWRILADLVSLESVAGSSAGIAQEYVGAYLQRHGYTVRGLAVTPGEWTSHDEYSPVPDFPDAALNLIAEPDTDGEVLLFAHIDTEPVHPGWQSPPASLVVADDRCYGLGSADDKVGIALMLATVHVLAGQGFRPGVLSVHGKLGGALGTLPVFAELRRKYRGALYLHPAETGNGLDELKHVSRGVLDLTIDVTGWSGVPREIGTPASARFADGGNAADLAIDLIRRIRGLVPDGCEVNLGCLEAGSDVSVVAQQATAKLRILFESPHTFQSLMALFEPLGGASVPDGYAVSIRSGGLRANPAKLDWQDRWCVHVRQAIEAATSQPCRPYQFHLASDLRFPMRMSNLPAVGYGPTGGNFYGPDEWVSRRSTIQTLAATILAVTGAPATG